MFECFIMKFISVL